MRKPDLIEVDIDSSVTVYWFDDGGVGHRSIKHKLVIDIDDFSSASFDKEPVDIDVPC